jgi:hypothetical protein
MNDTEIRTTAISPIHVGVYPAEVLTSRQDAMKLLGVAFGILALVLLVFALIAWLFSALTASIVAFLGVLLAIVGVLCFISAHAFVSVAVPTNTLVYYRGTWHKEGPVRVHLVDQDSTSWPKMLYTNPRRATWRTQPLRTPDGLKITYDVDITVQLNPKRIDTFAFNCGYSIEEHLFGHVVQQAIKREVAETGIAHQPDIYVPIAKRTPYMEKLRTLAMEAGKPFAAEKGLILQDVYVHNPQTAGGKESSAVVVPTEIIPAGDIQMSDRELLTTLKRDYDIVIPELFDPEAVKRSLEVLRNRRQPGLVSQVIAFFTGRVPQTEIGLLKAWEEYYTQVGATLEANHAAQKKLERAEVEHRLFLEESTAKVHGHRADVAEAEARMAEAQARKVRAFKEITDTERQMFPSNEKPAPRPQKAFGERIRDAEDAMERELAQLDAIKDPVLQERSQEEVRQKWAERINRISND